MKKTILFLCIIMLSGCANTNPVAEKEDLKQDNKNIECNIDSDCVAIGENGDCNAGCYNNEYYFGNNDTSKNNSDKINTQNSTITSCATLAPKTCKCENKICIGDKY